MSADSRNVADLEPKTRAIYEEHQRLCTAAGIPFTVTFTFRSIPTQNELYAQGRTKPGKIVTNARGGQSFHNYRCAYDGTPTVLLKLPNWGDTPAHKKETDRIWALYGKLAVQAGGRWGGNFKSIKDRPHVEYPIALADLQAGKLL